MQNAIDNYITLKNETLRDCLIKMSSSRKGVQIVVDQNYYVLGLLSDGDVRRALIKEVTLDIPVEQIMNLNPVVSKNAEEAKKLLMNNPELLIVPVLNDEGKLIGVLSSFDGNRFIANDKLLSPEKNVNIDLMNKQRCRLLAIIPARGGSKRIPQKNLARIGNNSLLSIAISAAQESKYIDHIIVSTDSENIAQEARSKGVKVPWLRPENISRDASNIIDVMVHAVESFDHQHGHIPEMVMLLEPTAPLRNAKLIDSAFEYFIANEADSLVSVNELRHNYHPEEVLRVKDEKYLIPFLAHRSFDTRKLRLEQDKVFVQNGLVYITKTNVLMEQHSIYGKQVLKYETDADLYCDIDDINDLKLANYKFKSVDAHSN